VSFASALQGANLSGITTAQMIEEMIEVYLMLGIERGAMCRRQEGKMRKMKRFWLIVPALGAAAVAAGLWVAAMAVRMFR
jgi:hypothetical protein